MINDPPLSIAEKDLPHIAIVVIGRNEAAHLSACLASVRAMRYPQDRLDIVYVDSDSSDGSPEIAEKNGARVIRLVGKPLTAARGRNAGWRSTSAPFVMFLDGDVMLEEFFIERSLHRFVNPTVVCVWGVLREVHPLASVYNRVFDLDWIQPAGDTETFGGIALVRKAALETVGGYNEELGAGEEPELSRRLRSRGGRIVHTNEPMALHDLAMTKWGQYWGRMMRTGRAYAQVSSMYANTTDPLWLRQSRGNLTRGIVYLSLPLLVILMCVAAGSFWPVFLTLAALLGLVIRTAWKARNRSSSIKTLLLFGVHSHFQQIPILLGQWSYWRSTPKAQ